jgi:periplasmic protein TonB
MTTTTRTVPATGPEQLGPMQRRTLVGVALAAHLAGGWALWQDLDEPVSPGALALLQVDWVEPARGMPPPPPPPRPMPPQPGPTRSALQPSAPVMAAAPILAAATASEPEPAPLPVAVPGPMPAPVAVAVAVADADAAPSTEAAPASSASATPAVTAAPPAAPRPVTLSATDWVRPPVYAYPREAVRRREQGVVALRILFDTQGVPRRVSLLRSSGSATLDEEALAKARAARARPRLQDGVAFEFVADTEAAFTF